jgi:hypothetical protein
MDLLVGAVGLAFRGCGGISRFKRTSGPLFFCPGGLKSLFPKSIDVKILGIKTPSEWTYWLGQGVRPPCFRQYPGFIEPLRGTAGCLTPLLACALIRAFGYCQDPLRSVESNTQNHLNSSTALEPPCQARSNGLLGTT